jgi:hypothetical protein
LQPTPKTADDDQQQPPEKPRNWKMIGAVVIIVIIALGAGGYLLAGGGSSMPVNKNVTIDPTSHCNPLTTGFVCTVFLHPTSGSTLTASEIKSVYINGTVSQETAAGSGNTITITATVQIAAPGCVTGCASNAATNSIPHVGVVQVDFTDGTQVSAEMGAGEVIA